MSEFKVDPVLDYPPPPRTHDGQFSDGKPSISSYAPPSDPRGAPSSSAASNGSAPSTPCKLFVGQIPAACTEDDLHRLFAPYGKLLEIVIFRNKHPTDRDRGMYYLSSLPPGYLSPATPLVPTSLAASISIALLTRLPPPICPVLGFLIPHIQLVMDSSHMTTGQVQWQRYKDYILKYRCRRYAA